MDAVLFTEISIYVTAHADDSQVFMQPQMFRDLTSKRSKVVFIIVTAGDAGFSKKFWKAREEGMKSSVRLCLAPLAEIIETTGSNTFNEHVVSYSKINNSIIYFLRLPDGNLDNHGFASNNFENLEKLRSGEVYYITAIDKSTKYVGWEDLQNTLKEIIVDESKGISNRWLNYLNPDPSQNPNDHPDHINTGCALESIQPNDGFQKALFKGYSVGGGYRILQPKELFWKAAMFAAYEKAVFDACGYSTLKEDISLYCDWCISSAAITIVVGK